MERRGEEPAQVRAVADVLAGLGAQHGPLVVAPPTGTAAQVAAQFPSAQVFALKGPQMELSEHLQTCERSGQLHRIDVDVLAPGAWTDVYAYMVQTIGLPLKA